MSRCLRIARGFVAPVATVVLALSVGTASAQPLGSARPVDTAAVFNEASLAERFGFDARSMAMGFTGIAGARDASGIMLNPATLVRIRRIEVRGGFSHLRYDNTIEFPDGITEPGMTQRLTGGSRDLTHTALGSIAATYPVPTYRGALVVAGSVSRRTNFKHTAEYERVDQDGASYRRHWARESESGGLWQYSAAAATDLSPKLSAGATLNVLDGSDEFSRDAYFSGDDVDSITLMDDIADDYIGLSGIAGITYQFSPEWTLGVTVETPTWYDVEEVVDQLTDTASSSVFWRDEGFFDYNVRHPFRFGAGLEYRARNAVLTADVRYTDWSQLEFTDPPSFAGDENPTVQDVLREVIEVHLGGELVLPDRGLSLRAGYFRDPLPFDDPFVADERQYLTLGAGLLVDKVMVVDVAYVTGGATRNHLRTDGSVIFTEKVDTRRVFLTVGYRI